FDDARAIHAGRPRQFDIRIGPGAEVGLHGIHPDGVKSDEHLAGARRGHRNFFEPEHFRPAELMDANGFHPNDSRIFSAAARGFGDSQIGRPITSQFAPSSMASRALNVRFWSPAASPGPRMPGVTSWTDAGTSRRSAVISSGEQTSPRKPAPAASVASRS